MKLPIRTAKMVAKPTGKIMTYSQTRHKNTVSRKDKLRPQGLHHDDSQNTHVCNGNMRLGTGSPVISTIMIVVNNVTLEHGDGKTASYQTDDAINPTFCT